MSSLHRLLDDLGVRLGWDCLHVGPDTADTCEALTRRVGRVGRVTALEHPELHRAEEGGYDLVHARLSGFDDPGTLARLRRATAPGGVVGVQLPAPDSAAGLRVRARLRELGLRDVRLVESTTTVTVMGRRP